MFNINFKYEYLIFVNMLFIFWLLNGYYFIIMWILLTCIKVKSWGQFLTNIIICNYNNIWIIYFFIHRWLISEISMIFQPMNYWNVPGFHFRNLPFLVTFSHWNLTCVVSHSHSLFFPLSNKWWEISAISFNFVTVADLWCKSDCASETLQDAPNWSSQTLHCRQNGKMFSALISKLPCQCQTRTWTRLSIDSPCDERVRSERFKGHLYPRRTPA